MHDLQLAVVQGDPFLLPFCSAVTSVTDDGRAVRAELHADLMIAPRFWCDFDEGDVIGRSDDAAVQKGFLRPWCLFRNDSRGMLVMKEKVRQVLFL